MMEMADLQSRFVIAGSGTLDRGAELWWLLDDLGFHADAPNCAVLFPDGYVEFVVVRPGVKPDDVPAEISEHFAKLHHPLRFVPNEATAESYWREAAYHLRGRSA